MNCSHSSYTMPNAVTTEKKRLINSILHFLRGEYKSGYLSSENAEGLEVAIQCLETIYETPNSTEAEPPLLDIYRTYLTLSVLQKPDASEQDKKEAERLKEEGNSAMTAGLFTKALELYTKAVNLDPKNAFYYCNRAAAHSKLLSYSQAINDCRIAIDLDPNYSKAYGRLGLAYCGLNDYLNALDSYKKALDLEPTNEGYRNNYELAKTKVNEFRYGPEGGDDSSKHNQGASGKKSTSRRPTSGSAQGGDSRPNPSMTSSPLSGFTDILENQLMGVVNQMIGDPSMQQRMTEIINGGGGVPAAASAASAAAASAASAASAAFAAPRRQEGGVRAVDELLHQVGQRLPQLLQASNIVSSVIEGLEVRLIDSEVAEQHNRERQDQSRDNGSASEKMPDGSQNKNFK